MEHQSSNLLPECQGSLRAVMGTRVAVAPPEHSSSVGGMNLRERMLWVLSNRDLTQRSWSLAAGLSERHVSSILTRSKTGEFRPDHATVVALAGAAGVDVQWLEDGVGSPGDDRPRVAREEPVRRADPPTAGPLGRALLVALDPERHELEGLDAIRSTLASTDLAQRSASDMIEAARRWLDAAARLRRRGEPVTAAGVLVEATLAPALEERVAAANAEGDRKAEELGVAPGAAAGRLTEALKRRR